MKRKLFYPLVAIAILTVALFLVGCDASNSGDNNPTATQSSTATAAPTSTPTAAPTASPTPSGPTQAPTPVPTSKPPAGYDDSVTIPNADILSLEFENGQAVDKSGNSLTVNTEGAPEIKLDAEIGREVAEFIKSNSDAFYITSIGDYYSKLQDGFTHEIFFKLTDDITAFQVISANMQQGGFGFDFEVNKNGYNTFGYSLNINGSYKQAYPEEDTEVDKYYHAVVTYDGSTLSLYVDGLISVENDLAGSPIKFPTGNAQRYVVGGDSGAGICEDYFNGIIAFVRLYDEPMNASQVYKLYTQASK